MHARAKHEPLQLASRTMRMLGLAPLLVAAPAWAGTWVVDDDGGPGVHFTDIPPAIAAASTGDLIVVRAGQYSAFTLDKAIVIRGETGVNVAPDVVIENILPGTKCALSTCHLTTMVVRNCDGGVLLESLNLVQPSPGGNDVGSFEYVMVENCNDVRLRSCSLLGSSSSNNVNSSTVGMTVWNSRVEIVSSSLRGQVGEGENECGIPTEGGAGLLCFTSSRAHAALSSIRGGDGGLLDSCAWGTQSGDGAAGVIVSPSAEIVLTGLASHHITGGHAGYSWSPGCGYGGQGDGGAGLRVEGLARYSGVTLTGGGSACSYGQGSPLSVSSGGSAVQPTTPDPTLALVGPEPGTSLSVELRAPPGANAHLWVGRTMIVEPSTGIEIELLTSKARLIALGIVPASGVITATMSLPPLPSGYILIAQADAVLTSGATLRTNSLAMTVR